MHDHFINGRWCAGSGADIVSHNPATNDTLWEGKGAALAEVDEAMDSARAAFPAWSGLALEERVNYLLAFKHQCEERREALAQAISHEVGKPLWEAHTEVNAMIGKIQLSVLAYNERTGESVSDIAGGKAVLGHKPHGVMVVLGPFNFPGHLPNGHIVPALLAGNTVVFKPSELTPMVAELMVQCWERAQLPAGVLNLVQGDSATGQAIIEHQAIDGICFTGSYQTGKHIHASLGGRPEVLLALEMGGNNPLIVHGVKDLIAAAYLTIQSAYLTSGQRCTCARRLIIPASDNSDEFISVLLNLLQNVIVGAPDSEPEPFMGPVISAPAADKVIAYQEQLLQAGAEAIQLATRGEADTGFVTPGLIDVTNVDGLDDKECFGPLLQVIRVDDFADAIMVANQTAYGLSAGLLSDDEALFNEFYRNSRAGIVNWNQQLTGASSALPFGGIGHSGNHRPSAFYAADYCAYPVAGQHMHRLQLPDRPCPGITLE
ncbi:MAG: succinylglutamate-semialdehyde dehydrogenase [Legionellales bacterium]|nr:succinylglutamate-semialdehyde dehydrogenase [Legionellales bacterium]